MNFKKYFEKNKVKLSDKEMIAIKLGGLITAVRLHADLSQAQLARKIGTQQPSLARAEAGDVEPSVEFLYKIAKKIGMKEIFLERLTDLFGLAQTNTDNKTYRSIVNNRPLHSPFFQLEVSTSGTESLNYSPSRIKL